MWYRIWYHIWYHIWYCIWHLYCGVLTVYKIANLRSLQADLLGGSGGDSTQGSKNRSEGQLKLSLLKGSLLTDILCVWDYNYPNRNCKAWSRVPYNCGGQNTSLNTRGSRPHDFMEECLHGCLHSSWQMAPYIPIPPPPPPPNKNKHKPQEQQHSSWTPLRINKKKDNTHKQKQRPQTKVIADSNIRAI